MKTKLLLFALLSLPLVSQARLGDTIQVLTNRFGAGVTVTGPLKDKVPGACAYFFEKNGIKQTVTFLRGVSVDESYLKLENNANFSAEEVQIILANNNLGGSWEFGISVGGAVKLNWKGPNDTTASDAIMEGSWVGPLVAIGTTKYQDAYKAASDSGDQNNLRGF